jgi:diguanylate cyclase (GGDEF)-like protein
MDETDSSPLGNEGARHFTGLAVRLLIDFLEAQLGPDRVSMVLATAGEHRHLAELTDDATWTSYAAFRRLLVAASDAVGGLEGLKQIGTRAAPSAESTAGTEDALHELGSPDVLYASMSQTNHLLWTICRTEIEQAGEREWLVTSLLNDGFGSFPELCVYFDGLMALVPTVFGMPPAEVVHEQCRCEGSAACVTRIRWFPSEDPTRRTEYLERRVQILEGRLRVLQLTVHELVSGAGIAELLERVVLSAARAVSAPAYALALTSGEHRTHTVGLDEAAAAELVPRILAGELDSDATLIIADVASPRCHYGRLAAINPGGTGFLASERVMLGVYASLAAAALDSAAAVDDSRQQAMAAHALLDLSTTLASLTTIAEVADRVARAVPLMVDCDHAAVVLIDPANRQARVAAAVGFSPDVEAALREVAFPVDPGIADPGFVVSDSTTPFVPGAQRLVEVAGVAAIARVPIAANGETVGWLGVGVADNPERLRAAAVEARLLGLAGQAASAIANARLLDQIRYQALHDALTGLPNRALILDRAEQMLARARREHHQAAALFIDLDNFKAINDTLGHSAGDELLQAVAARITGALRDSDTVGRLGGDEFVVLSEGASLIAGPELIAERIADVLHEPFFLGARGQSPFTVSASIGIASGDRPAAQDLLRDADIALYRAKAAGKGRFAVFEADMQSDALARLELEMDLHQALPSGQFRVVYQPVLDLDDMSVTGFEALLRWAHPTLGTIGPDEFIPILEDTGMILDVGRWVLREACRECAAWQAAGHRLSVSVNVSIRQLESDALVDDVRTALQESGLDADGLVIEITETALMRDTNVTVACLRRLKQLGVRLAIDDFGTGYSSLAYLRQFPVDELKIDRSFVVAMLESTEAVALTQALVKLGHTLGLRTVAEGIEQTEQLDGLRQNRCESGQGFLFSRPIAAEAVDSFLKDWSSTHVPQRAAGM